MSEQKATGSGVTWAQLTLDEQEAVRGFSKNNTIKYGILRVLVDKRVINSKGEINAAVLAQASASANGAAGEAMEPSIVTAKLVGIIEAGLRPEASQSQYAVNILAQRLENTEIRLATLRAQLAATENARKALTEVLNIVKNDIIELDYNVRENMGFDDGNVVFALRGLEATINEFLAAAALASERAAGDEKAEE